MQTKYYTQLKKITRKIKNSTKLMLDLRKRAENEGNETKVDITTNRIKLIWTNINQWMPIFSWRIHIFIYRQTSKGQQTNLMHIQKKSRYGRCNEPIQEVNVCLILKQGSSVSRSVHFKLMGENQRCVQENGSNFHSKISKFTRGSSYFSYFPPGVVSTFTDGLMHFIF